MYNKKEKCGGEDKGENNEREHVRIRRAKSTKDQQNTNGHERLGGEKGTGIFVELFGGDPKEGGSSITTCLRSRGIRTRTPAGLVLLSEQWGVKEMS